MSERSEIFHEADKIISERRVSSEKELDKRIAEAERKAPEIIDINRQFGKTGLRIFELITEGGDVSEKIIKLERENLEAQEMIRRALTEAGLPADYTDPRFYCDLCGDTGYSNGKRCKCFTDIVSKLSAERLNASSPLRLCSFDSFDISFYAAQDGECVERMRAILEYCRNYSANFSLTSPSVFMLGNTGLGKTHLSLAIADKVIKKGFSVAYDSIINYLMKIEKEHFGRSEAVTLPMLLDVDLLILDDLGSEYENVFYSSTIYNIINTRLNKRLPTIASTNLSPGQMQKRYDDRIISRLFSMYDYLRFTGKDIRFLKQKDARDRYEK